MKTDSRALTLCFYLLRSCDSQKHIRRAVQLNAGMARKGRLKKNIKHNCIMIFKSHEFNKHEIVYEDYYMLY